MDNLQEVNEKDVNFSVAEPQTQLETQENDVKTEEASIPQEEIIQESQDELPQATEENASVNEDLEAKWKAHKKKLAKAQREKHRIAAEAEKLREENENLKKYNQTFNQVSQTHYENSLKLRLEKAKEEKKKALELNDYEGQVDADIELASAIADLKALDNWKTQQSVQQYEADQYQKTQSKSQYNQHPEEIEINEQAERWLKLNPWFDENSSSYDPDKAEEVQLYAQALDAQLARQGREEEYFSKAYFNKIDNFVRHLETDRNRSREERMSNIPNVASVKRVANQKPQDKYPPLTEDEKIMARNAKVSEESWRKAKKEMLDRQHERLKQQSYF